MKINTVECSRLLLVIKYPEVVYGFYLEIHGVKPRRGKGCVLIYPQYCLVLEILMLSCFEIT